MRQVTDVLVWLAVIGVFAAVVYFTPQFADYVGSGDADQGRGGMSSRVVVFQAMDSPTSTP